MNCIDMNAWYSRVDKPGRPDFVVFDLDPPDEPDGFEQAIEVAHLIRGLLDEVELPGYVKTSGADGIHVLAPDPAPCRLRRHLRVRRGRVAPSRAAPSGPRHDRVAEEETLRRARRPPPERLGQDDRVGVLRAAEAGRAGVDAASVGRADGGRPAAGLLDGRRARARRARTATCTRPVLEEPRPLGAAARELARLVT